MKRHSYAVKVIVVEVESELGYETAVAEYCDVTVCERPELHEAITQATRIARFADRLEAR